MLKGLSLHMRWMAAESMDVFGSSLRAATEHLLLAEGSWLPGPLPQGSEAGSLEPYLPAPHGL